MSESKFFIQVTVTTDTDQTKLAHAVVSRHQDNRNWASGNSENETADEITAAELAVRRALIAHRNRWGTR